MEKLAGEFDIAESALSSIMQTGNTTQDMMMHIFGSFVMAAKKRISNEGAL